MDKMVSQLHEMALAEEIISYGEKLPLVSGSWDLSTGFWWNDLKNFMREKRNITDWRVTFEDGSEPLAKHLSDFLHREEGAQDVINFKFDGNLTCDVPAPKIMATKLGAFTYNDFDGPTQHIPAQDEVDRIVKVSDQNVESCHSDRLKVNAHYLGRRPPVVHVLRQHRVHLVADGQDHRDGAVAQHGTLPHLRLPPDAPPARRHQDLLPGHDVRPLHHGGGHGRPLLLEPGTKRLLEIIALYDVLWVDLGYPVKY